MLNVREQPSVLISSALKVKDDLSPGVTVTARAPRTTWSTDILRTTFVAQNRKRVSMVSTSFNWLKAHAG
jgi:hypothetical protein